jgi:predicted dehydrogenase
VITGPSHPYLKNVLIMPVVGVGYGISDTFCGQTYEFLRAVVTGRSLAGCNFEDGYAALLVCEAAQRSVEQGRPVSIQELAAQTEAGAA